MTVRATLCLFSLSAVLWCAPSAPTAADQPLADVQAMFDAARAEGRTGLARKSRPVDGRPAAPGEVIVTVIAGEGVETRSKPAEQGDMVVRNRCPETGNEEYLVKADRFAKRYEGPLDEPAAAGWAAYRPRGVEMAYFIVPEAAGAFSFKAPWGEEMVAKSGDAIVQVPDDPANTYRIAAKSFACTYDILEPAGG